MKYLIRNLSLDWKVQLTMSINFISFKDSTETCNMHTKSNNIEITVGSETDKITEELFKSLLQRYQEGLEELMKGSEFILIVLIYCITIFKKQV